MIIVDRIEEGTAVVFFGDERRDVPLSELPRGVREGTVLVETEDGLAIDRQAEEQRRRALTERTRRLFGR